MTRQKDTDTDLRKLPPCAADFITLVVKKMRYRRKVRADVMADHTPHLREVI